MIRSLVVLTAGGYAYAARGTTTDATGGRWGLTVTLIGYARCFADEQDLTALRLLLTGAGVAEYRIYLDHGLTGRRER